jgi:phosphoenolpyruvate-protein phosphotransferase (PTS system enzyme I)
MKRLQGKPISHGYAAGTTVVLESTAAAIPRRSIRPSQIETEVRRFRRALARATRELRRVRCRVLDELGKSHSAIFEAHLAILSDPLFRNKVKARIEGELVNSEQAVEAEVDEICGQLAHAGNSYLRERQQDIRDVERRVLGHLVGSPVANAFSLPPRSVLVARELLPSDTLNIDRDHLVALLIEEGGETSHVAILARALGVPAVTAIDGLLESVRAGTEVLVNGENGEVVVSPVADQSLEFTDGLHHWEQVRAESLAAEKLPCVTTDEVAVALYANIARPEEARQIEEHHLDGIGLLRTEFLFLDAIEPPAIDFQARVYRDVIESAQGRPVVVRTLDMAADKQPRFLAKHFDHRVLPFRGLRFSLKEANLFREQVAALTRAMGQSDVRILLPMVVDPQDVVRAADIISDQAEKAGLAKRPPIGVMIETPAAVVLFDRLIEKADFVSIGSNDLTQYLLAAERSAIDLDEDYSIHHPAVLRTIRQLVLLSTAAAKRLSVCGEAAGDPESACLLAGLGVRQLSMSPVRAARVRQILRSASIERLGQLAQRALECATTGEVRMLLRAELSCITGRACMDCPSTDTTVPLQTNGTSTMNRAGAK